MKFILKKSGVRIILFIFIVFPIFSDTAFSQNSDNYFKILPELGYKVGSQHPAIGYQFDLISSFCFKNRYSFGIGGGIASNMGMGGKTFPVFTDARISLHLKDPILFQNKDKINDFYIATKLGIDINKNMPFKTGFLASFDLAYKVDFIRIKNTNLPAFFTDIGIEYSSSKFKDEYRGFVIHDGVLRHMMFTMKIVFEIPVLKI